MTTKSLAYSHAESVFERLHTVATDPSPLSKFRHILSSEPFGTEQFIAWGEVDGRKARQVFSRGNRTKLYFLTTTFTEPNGEVVHGHIGPGSGLEAIDIVSSSLFMEILIRAEV